MCLSGLVANVCIFCSFISAVIKLFSGLLIALFSSLCGTIKRQPKIANLDGMGKCYQNLLLKALCSNIQVKIKKHKCYANKNLSNCCNGNERHAKI